MSNRRPYVAISKSAPICQNNRGRKEHAIRRRSRARAIHTPSLFARLLARLRGREQKLVRAAGNVPLLLLSFPSGEEEIAETVEAVWAHLLPSLPDSAAGPYRAMLPDLPHMIVVLLRPFNACSCLGHHHPAGTESRLARRLTSEMGATVGEIDLAYEAIRGWQPHPLSSLAAGEMDGKLAEMHLQAALLGVMLHEMEHLAYPERAEREVRTTSNEFYSAVMEELVRMETGGHYGMAGEQEPDR